MRPHLLDPTFGDPRLAEAIALGRELYALFEAGADCTTSLQRLGSIAGRSIDSFALEAAFGSVKPETFARRQLVAWNQLPTDLAHSEMLEMIDNFSQGGINDEFQVEYWLECLRENTGDQKISDLLFWPGDYFGDGDDARMMSSSDILATALQAGGKR